MSLKPALTLAALTTVLALHAGLALAQVQLKSRTIQPSGKTTATFLSALKAAPGNALHGLASFSRIPNADERKTLERAGIGLLAPFSGFTYRVRVEKRLDLNQLRIQDLRIDLIALAPQDRVEPHLWREDFAKYTVRPPGEKPRNYVLNADGTLNLNVRIHARVEEAETRRVLQKYAQKFKREGDQAWVVLVPRASLRALADEDIVQWIDAGPLPFLPENDATRAAINVDAVQNFNVTTGQVQGLGGNGVQVGVFDKGVDQTHDDFGARVVRDDAGLMEYHATHVAGIIAGDGTLSNGVDSWGVNNNGAPFQWRGMAPRAELIDIDQMPPFGQNGKNPDTHMEYISNAGMDLSNHSYVFSTDGAYDDSNQARDQIIQGNAPSGGNQVPPRLHVTSAGNHGQVASYGNQVGYFALTKQLKNALVVGNWDVVANRIHDTSSLGPAHDGRIKPDVVAPGRTIGATAEAPNGGVRSTGFCASNENPPSASCLNSAGISAQRQDFYRVLRGTSAASAVATGALALLLEQYATTYGVNLDQSPPLPSTLRAVMIHTARDTQASAPFMNPDGAVQDTPGPDFVTGWGLIDAQAAVNVVASRHLIEGTVPATCHVKTYLFKVPSLLKIPSVAAAPPLKKAAAGTIRITLAWDDIAGDAAAPATAPKLVNDLDLVLVDPYGTAHYPWQLDQRIVNSAGNAVPDALQECGTAIRVERQFTPVADPASANDTIPPGAVPKAVRGRDHLNNVEVVQVPAIAGTWVARVVGFNVPQGPQRFSLIGRTFEPYYIHHTAFCDFYPVLCRRIAIPINLCERIPKLCEARFSFPGSDRIRVQFVDLKQKLVLPLDRTCGYALDCPPCAADALCSAYDMQLGDQLAHLQAEIYSSSGRLMKRERPGSATKRMQFNAVRGERYFLVLSPGPGTKLEADYDISFRLR